MIELLFLLLPVTVAYGWVMGKQNARREFKQKQESLNQALTSSVRLLLRNKEEQAFDYLIRYLDDSPTSIDSYLTMAQLFRKKGEFDKAITIHQGLLNLDAEVPIEVQHQIQIELANDFLSAGMFERAEAPLLGLLATHLANNALAMLLHIYEQTREWQKGIDASLNAQDELTAQNRQLVSHFYCELADQADSFKVRKNLLRRALKVNHQCTRSMVSLAKLYTLNGQKQQARELVVKVLDNEPSFAPALFNIAPECFVDEFEQTAWLYWLIKEKNITSVTAHNQMADYIVKEQGIDAGRRYMIEHLRTVPSVRGFAKLIELEREFISDSQFDLLLELISRYIALKPNYECRSCGFSSNHFSWRCQACNSWETIKPLSGLDGI